MVNMDASLYFTFTFMCLEGDNWVGHQAKKLFWILVLFNVIKENNTYLQKP